MMESHVVNALILGAVICRTSDRDAFEYLSIEANFEEANRFLARIDKRIYQPPGGEAFYAAHTGANSTKKSDVQSLHKKILGEMRPVLAFMDLCMAAGRSDAPLRPGDEINAASIVAVIDADNKLRSDLQDLVALLPRSTGTTNRERFECVLKRLDGWGYIRLENAEREIYRATGMVNVFHEYLAFFIEHTPGASEFIEAQKVQGELF